MAGIPNNGDSSLRSSIQIDDDVNDDANDDDRKEERQRETERETRCRREDEDVWRLFFTKLSLFFLVPVLCFVCVRSKPFAVLFRVVSWGRLPCQKSVGNKVVCFPFLSSFLSFFSCFFLTPESKVLKKWFFETLYDLLKEEERERERGVKKGITVFYTMTSLCVVVVHRRRRRR